MKNVASYPACERRVRGYEDCYLGKSRDAAGVVSPSHAQPSIVLSVRPLTTTLQHKNCHTTLYMQLLSHWRYTAGLPLYPLNLYLPQNI